MRPPGCAVRPRHRWDPPATPGRTGEFPARLAAPLALGPELAEDGIPALTASLESEFPGVAVAPMWLRGRAIGLLLALRAARDPLVELGRLGAAALELAGGYTDVIDAARRRKETRAAAELQQGLLPPRIARMGGGELAGSVLAELRGGRRLVRLRREP